MLCVPFPNNAAAAVSCASTTNDAMYHTVRRVVSRVDGGEAALCLIMEEVGCDFGCLALGFAPTAQKM